MIDAEPPIALPPLLVETDSDCGVLVCAAVASALIAPFTPTDTVPPPEACTSAVPPVAVPPLPLLSTPLIACALTVRPPVAEVTPLDDRLAEPPVASTTSAAPPD